ncbi:helix-turn-helix domain-containing protein [Sediminibacterium sp.]|uniref:helix-turn-helix domain-containing protein n=1 Tax=Sediminibacterium sp. TaxID=1917865 RepID=UPI00272F7F87|nr:helix-turn-helix domain-containing protein [Sediminibacterium sp.]MDP2420090.1 helix-turn-helix domain-containing protein [Sediminibacterium sp.]
MSELIKELRDIKSLVALNKDILTMDEFCAYAGISKHQAYHLTSENKIKFYRPHGKLIYFDIEDVKEFLLQNPVNKKNKFKS